MNDHKELQRLHQADKKEIKRLQSEWQHRENLKPPNPTKMRKDTSVDSENCRSRPAISARLASVSVSLLLFILHTPATEASENARMLQMRAANIARMRAEKSHGGLSVYRASACMYRHSGGPCLVESSGGGFLFRFPGGAPGWEQATPAKPRVFTEILISPDARSVLYERNITNDIAQGTTIQRSRKERYHYLEKSEARGGSTRNYWPPPEEIYGNNPLYQEEKDKEWRKVWGDYAKYSPFAVECTTGQVDQLIADTISASKSASPEFDENQIFKVRYSALLACGSSAIPKIIDVLKGNNKLARHNATIALGDMGVVNNSLVVPKLMLIVEDEEEVPLIRAKAIESLLRITPIQGKIKDALNQLKSSKVNTGRLHAGSGDAIPLGLVAKKALSSKRVREQFDASCPLRRLHYDAVGKDIIQYYRLDPSSKKCIPDGVGGGVGPGAGVDSCLRMATACMARPARPIGTPPKPQPGTSGAGEV